MLDSVGLACAYPTIDLASVGVIDDQLGTGQLFFSGDVGLGHIDLGVIVLDLHLFAHDSGLRVFVRKRHLFGLRVDEIPVGRDGLDDSIACLAASERQVGKRGISVSVTRNVTDELITRCLNVSVGSDDVLICEDIELSSGKGGPVDGICFADLELSCGRCVRDGDQTHLPERCIGWNRERCIFAVQEIGGGCSRFFNAICPGTETLR